MNDDIRICTCYEKIESVAVIISRTIYVLFEVEVVKNAKKLLGVVRSESVWILKSPVMIISEVEGTKISRRYRSAWD